MKEIIDTVVTEFSQINVHQTTDLGILENRKHGKCQKKLYLDISFSNCRTSKIKNSKKAKLEKEHKNKNYIQLFTTYERRVQNKIPKVLRETKSTNLDFCALQNYLPKCEAKILYQIKVERISV